MPSALFECLSLHTSKKSIPAFIYGTAWKKERTADLVCQALSSGFRGVDTAAQPRHYREDLVGEGIRRAASEGKVARQDLFIQTKYTTVRGQDPDNLPYDTHLTVAEQVNASVRSSLHNLRPSEDTSSADTTILDCLVLHSPLPTIEETVEAWRTLETYVPHKIRNLGISNIQLSWLRALYEAATIKPAVVQNRFVRQTQFDRDIRAFCLEKEITYQSFWTFTGNKAMAYNATVGAFANQVGIDAPGALYCLVLGLDNVVIMNGTTNERHMLEDLAALEQARKWAEEYPDNWKRTMESFEFLLAAGGIEPQDNLQPRGGGTVG